MRHKPIEIKMVFFVDKNLKYTVFPQWSALGRFLNQAQFIHNGCFFNRIFIHRLLRSYISLLYLEFIAVSINTCLTGLFGTFAFRLGI